MASHSDSSALRRLGRRLAGLEGKIKDLLENGIGLGSSSFIGQLNQYTGTGSLGSSFGGQYDGSNGVYALTGPLPPTPSLTPDDIEQVPGGIKIRWQGLFEGGETVVAPLGFTQVEVHVSDDPLMSGLMFSTLRTYITSARGGDAVVMLPESDVGYYIRLVTRTNAGRASLPSMRLGPVNPGTFTSDMIDPDIIAKIEAADGKRDVTFAITNPPSTNTGGQIGDIWFKRDVAGAGAKIQGWWEWDGTTWQPRVLADEVLSSLTVAKLVSGVLQAGVTATIGDPAGARIEISGTAIQQIDASEQITFQLTPGGGALFRGTLTGQSNNFTESTSGWRIEEDGDAFYQSLSVYDNVTAKKGSFTELDIGGVPVVNMINSLPIGLVAAGFDNTVNLSSIVNETGIVELGFVAYPNRAYMVLYKGGKFFTDDDTFASFTLRCTKDGTAPTISSQFVTILPDRSGPHDQYGSWPWYQLNDQFLFYPEVTNPNGQFVRLLLSFARSRGLGAVAIDNTATQLDAWVIDIGGVRANSIRANNSRAASPPPPPPTPKQTYDRTFSATWSASYRANGTRWAEGDKCYQGYGDSFNGNQASLIGFDYATINALLAGATIKSASLQLHNWHTWNYSGGTAYVGSHPYAAMPASFPGGVLERRWAVGTAKGGWVSLDATALANEIKAGTSCGIVLGHAPDSNNANYGYWYGANYAADRPNLRIIWEK